MSDPPTILVTIISVLTDCVGTHPTDTCNGNDTLCISRRNKQRCGTILIKDTPVLPLHGGIQGFTKADNAVEPTGHFNILARKPETHKPQDASDTTSSHVKKTSKPGNI